jgi:hypothetical protein
LFFYERAIGLSLAIAKDVRSGRVRENLILVGVRCLLAIAKEGCLRESLTLLGVRRLLAVPKEVRSICLRKERLVRIGGVERELPVGVRSWDWLLVVAAE